MKGTLILFLFFFQIIFFIKKINIYFRKHKKRKHKENDVEESVKKPKCQEASINKDNGNIKREVKEECQHNNNDTINSKEANSTLVVNGNPNLADSSLKEEIKTKPAVSKKTCPIQEINSIKIDDDSSDSEEVEPKKDEDSDIDVAVIEDDIDLEDLMRQKVIASCSGLGVEVFFFSFSSFFHINREF